jgi:hypothetical protein
MPVRELDRSELTREGGRFEDHSHGQPGRAGFRRYVFQRVVESMTMAPKRNWPSNRGRDAGRFDRQSRAMMAAIRSFLANSGAPSDS